MPPGVCRICGPGFRRGFHRARDDADHAYASGYVSPRRVSGRGGRGCRCSLSSVSSRRSPRGNWKYGYVLLLHPHDVVETLAKTREIPEAWRTQYLHRLQQIGSAPRQGRKAEGAKSEESVA